jgi:hypothetical protein
VPELREGFGLMEEKRRCSIRNSNFFVFLWFVLLLSWLFTIFFGTGRRLGYRECYRDVIAWQKVRPDPYLKHKRVGDHEVWSIVLVELAE